MRSPMPAPSSSRMMKSSPSGVPVRRALRLNGTPMSQRWPVSAGCQRESVTLPMTSAMRMAVQFLQGGGEIGRARDRRGDGTEHLPQFEVGAAWHLDGEEIRAERAPGAGGMGGGQHGGGAEAAMLVRDAADERWIAAEEDGARVLGPGNLRGDGA